MRTGREGGAAFLQELDVKVLPLVQFYAGGERVEAFPCGPRKIELLREKLEEWQNWHKPGAVEDGEVDQKHIPASDGQSRTPGGRDSSKLEIRSNATATKSEQSLVAELVTARNVIKRAPLLARLSKTQLDAVLHEGRVANYDAGDVLIAEGDIGRRFFILLKGECDVFELSKLTTSSHMPGFSPNPTRTAFGSRTNTLFAGAYFGERALVTNEPRAASIVAGTPVVAFIVDRSALAKVDQRVWGEDTTAVAEMLRSTSEGMLWGYERTEPMLDSNTIKKSRSDYFETTSSPLPVMQRLRLLQSVIRAFDQAAARSPRWGNAAEIIYRKGLVAQLTNYQRQEFEQTFELLDRDRDGSISGTDLAALMIAVGRHPDAFELANMINKANPEVEGTKNLKLEDFLALMAQAEFSAMFLEAFKLLDPQGHGWVESELLWQMMDVLIPSTAEGHSVIPDFSAKKMRELIDTFGVSDGHIDYQAFVKIMMQQQG